MNLKNICLLLLLFIIGCKQEKSSNSNLLNPQQKFSYPVIFKPEKVSTKKIEFSPSLSPDRRELYFVTSDSQFQTYEIQKYKFDTDSVTKIPFSIGLKDYSPFITVDDKYMFFASYRNINEDESLSDNPDIWFSERVVDGWGIPVNVGSPINTEYGEGFVSVAANGNLYFESNRPGGHGDWDIYGRKNREWL